jgi:hypothetical protein
MQPVIAAKARAQIFLIRSIYLTVRLIACRRQLLKTLNMMKGVLGFFASFYRYGAYQKGFAKMEKRDDDYVFKRLLHRGKAERAIIKNFLTRNLVNNDI